MKNHGDALGAAEDTLRSAPSPGMKTFAWCIMDRLVMRVHGPLAPSDREWGAYLDFRRAQGIERTAEIVFTLGGGPTRGQRRALGDLMGGRPVPLAILTPSGLVRGLVRVASLLAAGPVKAFDVDRVRDALEFLEVPVTRAQLVEGELLALLAQLGDVDDVVARRRAAAEGGTRRDREPEGHRGGGSRMTLVHAIGMSDVGRKRRGNEDAFVVLLDLGFYAVADGVGGHDAGEVASWMAIDTVQDALKGADGVPRGLVGAVEHANRGVRAEALRRHNEMATTFTGLLLGGGIAKLAHVGDSRAYLLRRGVLKQLTDDHTVIAAQIAAGVITPADAATSTFRGVLTRAVGSHETVEVDTRQLTVEPGDLFLLCSDGLYDVVDDETIAAVLLRERDLTRAAAELVQRANDAGGPDNVTVVLVRALGGPAPS